MKNLALASRQPGGLLLGPPKASLNAEQNHPSAARSHKLSTCPVLGTSQETRICEPLCRCPMCSPPPTAEQSHTSLQFPTPLVQTAASISSYKQHKFGILHKREHLREVSSMLSPCRNCLARILHGKPVSKNFLRYILSRQKLLQLTK